MIYTVTFNPAVDVVISVSDLALGKVNRTKTQEIYYGGKGICVSCMLHTMGRECVALGFLAGSIGRIMQSTLEADGVKSDFIFLPEGETRINTKLRVFGDDGSIQETGFNANGPSIGKAELDELMRKLDSVVEGDIVVVSGRVPSNLGDGVYADILDMLADNNVKVTVDATGDLLTNTISHKPFLIKPNDDELAEIAGCDPDDLPRLIEAARELHEQGAVNVLVSRGGKGAFLVDEYGIFHEMDVLEGKLDNSVGAGDSTVAGFVHGYLKAIEDGVAAEDVYQKAFEMAMACGMATAFAPWLGPREDVERLLERIEERERAAK